MERYTPIHKLLLLDSWKFQADFPPQAKEKPIMTRSKFKCTEVTDRGNEDRSYIFEAVYSDDPKNPNNEFFKFTPAGKLTLSCLNPAVRFEAGKEYFLDITPAE